tara:strand:+ start:490 stop:651 length:162 start_codon:yes stop_codon:yes gene_type:complete
MNCYLETFKRVKNESMRGDIEEMMEDLLSIVAEDRGNNFVISLLGDYLQSLEE